MMRLLRRASAALALSLLLLPLSCTDAGVVLTGPESAPRAVLDDLTVGPYHTCGLLSGEVLCWGDGASGALGTGDENDRNVPTRLHAGADFESLAAGEHHTCGLRKAGSLWCWGAVDHGQIGTGAAEPATSPAFVSTQEPVIQIATKYAHGCAIDETHALYCWGDNTEGELGQDEPYPGPPGEHPTPARVGTDNDWVEVSTGQGHTCAVRTPGTLWCWGRNTDGELGLGEGSPGQIRAPRQVGDLGGWHDIRCGQSASCALRGGGELWCWGLVFAAGMSQSLTPSPARIGTAGDWTAFSFDTFHGCGLRGGGDLHCWGWNADGQLGTGDNDDRTAPTLVGPAGDWLAVSAGRFHTCARRKDGTVQCTGKNDKGQLGTGDNQSRNAFTTIAFAP
jgi:alpha-tubulin suppressor-like RCC1 family protein